MTINQEFLDAFFKLPTGVFQGASESRRYVVSRTALAGGKAHKLVANELGGTDYISLNLYDLKAGQLLKPCEMPEEKVISFVLNLVPDA